MMSTPTAIGIALVLSSLVTVRVFHAGHNKGIPTKGVRIDAEGQLHMEQLAQKAVGVALAKVDLGTIEEAMPLNARVVLPWNQGAYASSRVEGVIEKVLVRPGQEIEAGHVLAVAQSLPVEGLQTELEQAQIGAALAEKNVQRATDLGEAIVAGREILALEAERDDRKNTIAMLRNKLRAIGPAANHEISIVSPIDGTVVHLDVMIGQHIQPTQHLFEIHQLREVWVECEVPENFVGSITKGQNVKSTFFTYSGRTWPGTIDLVSYTIEETQNTRRVYVRLKNPDHKLLPGMFGTAMVITHRAQEVLVAPASAIVTDGAERYAFVQQKEGVYKKVNVVLGVTDGQRVEVIEGLEIGDEVITAGNHEISSLFVQGILQLSPEAEANIGFAAEEADVRTIDRVMEINARVVSPPELHAVATNRIEGKIGEIHVLPGQQVKVGQALADVSSLELQNSQLELILVHLKQELVRKQLGYIRKLDEKGIPPRKELLRLESQTLELESRYESLRRSLLIVGLTDAEITNVVETQQPLPAIVIRAPIDGLISDLHAIVGQVVSPGEEIFDLVDLRTVWLEGAFFERDVASLLEGPTEKPVVIRAAAYPDREWRGAISFVNRALDGGEHLLQAWVEIDNSDGALLPGMHAALTVTLAKPEDKVIAVQNRMILTVARRHYLFVKQGKEFKRVEVELGRRDANYTEIVRGIYPGDQIVVTGVNEMNNAFSAVR